jgi:hypothetical protein
MSNDSGCKSCLNITATLVTIAASIVSIIAFFFSDADSFLQACSDFLGSFLPGVGVFLANLNQTIEQFATTYPAASWISALLLLIIAGLISFWLDAEAMLDSPLYTLLILSPLVFGWIWIFSGVASLLGIILFVLGFIIAVLAVPLLDLVFE